MTNPYSTPRQSADNPPNAAREDETLATIAKTTFLAWEKLRLYYNATLAVLVLLMTFPTAFLEYRILRLVLGGAFAANCLFFAGPVMETYIRWLGYQRSWPRWFLYTSGVLLSLLLAFALLSSALLPSPD